MANEIDIYTRQRALPIVMPRGAAAVVGCGGVGSWTAYFLALAGVKNLWLFDTDVVSDHNLNRIPIPANMVGLRKTQAIAAMIAAVRPECNIMTLGNFSPEVANQFHLGTVISHIVCTTDSIDSRRMVESWARDNYINYHEAGADGDYGSATGETATFSTPSESDPGYASVPVWVGPCVVAAYLAVSYILHGNVMRDRTIRIGWSPNDGGGIDLFDSNNQYVEEETESEQISESSEGESTQDVPF